MEALRSFLPGLLDFATAFLFAATWIRPEWLGRAWVKSLMLVMLVEFLVIHSFAFLHEVALDRGFSLDNVLALLGFGAVYLLFAAAFAAAFRSWWPVWMFGWLIGSKLWALGFGVDEPTQQRAYVQQVWLVSLVAYLVGVGLTSFLPCPRLGIRGTAMHYGLDKGASGLWVEQPHRVIAFGLLYFLAVGVARIYYAPG